MELDLGGQEVVTNPSPEEVRHYLRYMRAESPFIVLSKDDGAYIQALYTTDKECYRVEHRLDKRQFYALADYETAVSLFHCFMDARCDLASQTRWKRLYHLNPRVDACLAWAGLVVVLGLLALLVVYELGLI